jgi:hypothetical protein
MVVRRGVSMLYFETDARDGFRESMFSKEQRLEPQITNGVLTARVEFPPMVSVFASTGDQLCTSMSQVRLAR